MSATETVRTCPECAGALRVDGTETICTECGLVVDEDRIDRGPEWRNFEDGPDRRRTGAPLSRSRHDRGLSTEIGHSNRVTGRKRRRLSRMRTQHDRSKVRSTAERNQIYGFTEIRRVTAALSLPTDIRDQACVLFETAQDESLFPGRSLEGFAAAAVYAVCRTNGLARTTEEITGTAKASPEEFQAAYDAMNRELELPTGPIDPGEYLPRFATELGLGSDVEAAARSLLDSTPQAEIGGRNPSGVAAAALYAVTDVDEGGPTQVEAAELAGVTPVTLRSAARVLVD
ncbi:transcription initiation factor IIB [Halodesulfurarchaeum formicicum]|uniref:Transcription initiation factor TFB n=1 Tax=Halodesulfurarchaeum formicicum TaxID=1873524 RepID=A0A1J1A8W9_9EURY|nr:transcription initiation factor IIB family protein [Halodesulfurarchaeum formicicum]APE94566.1 transcription initiation factor TFB [Halodesulfurarchaeum formicicum]